jgi:hypothetical protein
MRASRGKPVAGGQPSHNAGRLHGYSRDQSFSVLRENWPFLLVMAAGSIIGTFIGGLLLGIGPNAILLPFPAALLVISSVKIWRHK